MNALFRRGVLSRVSGARYFHDRGFWRVQKSQQFAELLNLRATHFVHEKIGTQWIHLRPETTAANSSFALSLRTIPGNSTGVSHILEHMVLCGSKAYPVRDPFFRMQSRSIASFMNAMTAPDFTVYPFATPNHADFFNLMRVYLDAVFRPLLKDEDFWQEGWRLEPAETEEPSSPLVLKGVVLNEMRGVYGDAQQVLQRHLLNKTLPSNTYSNCSGGIPLVIPELSVDELREFHAKHYNPGNAKIVTFGNFDLHKAMDLVEQYMGDQSSSKPSDIVPNETRWKEPRSTTIHCAHLPSGPNMSSVVVSYMTCDVCNVFDVFVLQILSELLTSTPNAPFYKSLVESGLAPTLAPCTGYSNYTRDTLFTIGVQGLDLRDKNRVLETIENTFKETAENGFDSRRLESILHRTELELKNVASNNLGVNLALNLVPFWNHMSNDQNPLDALKMNENIERLRAELKANPRFLQDELKRHFVDNQHRLVLTMEPKDSYLAEEEAQFQNLEETMRQKYSGQEEDLYKKGLQLQEIQKKKDDLSTLPSLKLSDIVEELPSYKIENVTLNKSTQTQIIREKTNGLVFFRALLDVKGLSEEQKSLWPVYLNVANQMGAGDLDYNEQAVAIDLSTAGLDLDANISEHKGDSKLTRTELLLSSHCLERNTDKMLGLWIDLLTKLTINEDRLKTILMSMASESVNSLAHRGHIYAMTDSAKNVSYSGQMRDLCSGLSFVRLLSSFARNQLDLGKVIEALRGINEHLIKDGNITLALTSGDEYCQELQTKVEREFLANLPQSSSSSSRYYSSPLSEVSSVDQYYVAPFPVHYCSSSLPGVGFDHSDFAALSVTCQLLSLKYLHPEIREQGGAYGAGVRAKDGDKVISFFSYRDPHAQRTLEVFDRSAEWLKACKDYSEDDVQEAKIAVFKSTDQPELPSRKGLREFLSDIDHVGMEKHRKALKKVTLEDIRNVADKYFDAQKVKINRSVIGPSTTSLDGNTWQTTDVL